jgi:hypothetical protein
LYDIENDIIVDAKLEPLAVDERSLAKEHFETLAGIGPDLGKRKPIVIFDCEYPSKDFIKLFLNKEINYVMRVQKGFNPRIDKMKTGDWPITLSDGNIIRALVFRLANGKR